MKTAFVGQEAQVEQATDTHQLVRQMASGLILVGTRNHTAKSGSNYFVSRGRRVRETPQVMPELDYEGRTVV